MSEQKQTLVFDIFSAFIDIFFSDLPGSEVAASQNQIFGCGPLDPQSCRTGKGITLTTPHTWTKVPIPRLRTTTTLCMTTPSSAGRACGGSSTTAHRTDSKEAIPEVTGHLVPPEGAAGVSSSPLFSSAWGCSGRSSVSQSTFQTKVQ